VLNVKCDNDYSVQDHESLRGHCTNEQSQKVTQESEKRCDLRRQQKMERSEGAAVTCDGRLFHRQAADVCSQLVKNEPLNFQKFMHVYIIIFYNAYAIDIFHLCCRVTLFPLVAW